MLSTLPRLIGHRGAKEAAPENTLVSVREAARQGAAWIEVDVMLTADGVPVIIHDDTLDRTTSGHGPVADIDLARLKRLDAGGWFAPRFAGEEVPTLSELLEQAVRCDLGVNLEIKPSSPDRAGATAAAALDVVLGVWPAERPLLLSSFDTTCLEVARARAPGIPRGYLIDEPPADWAAVADRLGADTIHVNQARQTAETVAAFRAGGRPVLAYTVNDAARARTLFGWGVAAVFTDAPGRLAADPGI